MPGFGTQKNGIPHKIKVSDFWLKKFNIPLKLVLYKVFK
jgi:hypothetical protein